MKNRVVTATEFKAKCLALLDEVDAGETITVTKRGRPVATVQPAKKKPWKTLKGAWAGRVDGLEEALVRYKSSDIWDVVHEKLEDILG